MEGSSVLARFADFDDVVWRFVPSGLDDRYSPDDLAHIEETWNRRREEVQQKGGSIFDAPIVSLLSLDNRGPSLHLTCGTTSYRHYVGTRNPKVDITRADPIGSIVVPLSKDGYIPIGRRSRSAEANPGRLFTFGGYFDPREDFDESGKLDVKICIGREVKEELGCQIDQNKIKLLGLIYDHVFCPPEVVALAPVDVEGNQFRTMSWQAELESLELIVASQLVQFVADRESDLTPALKTALLLAADHI